jgi:hypothetical protein
VVVFVLGAGSDTVSVTNTALIALRWDRSTQVTTGRGTKTVCRMEFAQSVRGRTALEKSERARASSTTWPTEIRRGGIDVTYHEFDAFVSGICADYNRNRKLTGFSVRYVEPMDDSSQVVVTFFHRVEGKGRLLFRVKVEHMIDSSYDEIRNFISESIGIGVRSLIVDLMERKDFRSLDLY